MLSAVIFNFMQKFPIRRKFINLKISGKISGYFMEISCWGTKFDHSQKANIGNT